MITSEKFLHDNLACNQWEKKSGDWAAFFQESKKYSDFVVHNFPICGLAFAFKEQLLQYLRQKLRIFSKWKVFRDVDKMFIKTPLFHKSSHALKNSWLQAW